MKKALASLRISPIVYVLFAGFILRLVLSFFGTLRLDQGTFIAWSMNLAQNGFKTFYNGWSDYFPGYLYILWLLGKLNNLNIIPQVMLYKLPAMFFDIGTGYLIYLIVRELKDIKWALLAASIYIFNPAIFANSSIWGQVDSLTIFFSLLAVYAFDKNESVSAVSLALGTLVKPQAAVASLVILAKMLYDKWGFRKMAFYIFLSGLVFVLGFIPFAGDANIITFIVGRVQTTLDQYPYTSINAFNYWGLFGFWAKENTGIIPANIVGYVVFLVSFAISAVRLKGRHGWQYYLLALGLMANFLFFTRMHERHMLPAIAPLLISSVLSPGLFISVCLISISYVANLFYSHVWISQDFKSIFSQEQIILFIIANLVSFILVMFSIFRQSLFDNLFSKISISKIKEFKLVSKEGKEGPVLDVPPKYVPIILGIIIAFSLFSRVLWLASPPGDYFDEVYHAFTAREMLHGNPKAWEWWNTPPEGFAYEWTHPPLAKEGMVIGMLIFGENSFGWRIIQAILGTGVVYLVYLLSKNIFGKESVALLSAAVFSFEGLALVMSRIGMNDTYMLFFGLLSILLFIKDKRLFSSIAYGLALSSKWSALWIIPILGITYIVYKKKFSLGLLWFLFVPLAVYIASYIPMFTSGHSFDIFIGVQKQMWWYHTGLKATHPYTSSWWSWPLDLRPVYLYTSDEINNWVARIYAFGNPFILWSGLTAIVIAGYESIVERRKKLGLVVFSYLMFFVPWALSPRIMFFYHYLPSIPFLAMAAGWVLAHQNRRFIYIFLSIGLVSFLYFYPHWAGLQVPLWLDKSYYWISSWR